MYTVFSQFKKFRFSRQIFTEEDNVKFLAFLSSGSYTDTWWQPTCWKTWSKFVFLPTMLSRIKILSDKRGIFTRRYFGVWFSRML